MTALCNAPTGAVKVLVFSFGRLKMGTYAGNVSAVIDPATARGRGIKLIPLSGLLGTESESEAAPGERGSNVLVIKNSDPALGILIDSLEEMAEVEPAGILPLPRSVLRCEGLAPYIGGIVRYDEIILILDMQKIAAVKETA